MSSINRKLANLITSTGDVASSALDNAASMQVFSSVDSLPTSSLSAGDQALVGTRLYISNGSGWYNVALINATPTLTIDPTGAVALAVDGSTPTVITLTGTDSDNADASLVYSAESDGNFGGLATLSQDSSVFTITPLSEDSATTTSSTLTFKVSDGINFGSGTTAFTLSFITIVDNSKYTSFLAKADTAETDNQADASTNNHTITENGNVTSTAFSPYHPGGYSVAFAGSDDYLGFDNGYIATNGTWWNSSGFTLELWFYKTVSTGTTGTVFDNRQSGTTGFLLTNKNNGWDMYLNGNYLFQNVGTEKVGQWVHIALVASGTTVTLYEDGTSIYTTGSAPNTSSYAYFGRSQNTVGAVQYSPRGTNVDWPGYMYDIRISSGSRYTTAFTPSETPHENDSNTILLACSSPMLKDKSSNNHQITVFGDGISTARFTPHDHDPYTKAEFGGAVYFDGSGDNLSLSGHSDFNMGSNFTFECWCYPTSSSNAGASGNALLMLVWNGSNNSVWLSYTSATKFEFRISYVGGWAHTLTSTDAFAINQWYHVAAIRNSGTTYLFINGVQQATGSNNTDVSSTGNTVSIGSQGSGRYFQGYIKDARIVNGTAVYTSAFTPPTAPLTAITNTKLLTCTNKNNIWDAGGREAIVSKTGNTTASNTQRKFTESSAIYLDGSGDNLTVSDLRMGSGDCTFELWMYQDVAQSSSYRAVLASSTYGSGTPFILYTYGSNVTPWFSSSGGPHISGAFTAFTWHHIALVRNSGTWTLYIDGTSAGTSTTGGTYNFANTSDFRFGENLSGSYDWKGYIQDPRFTLGLARYTSNFTPPTAEFSG
jgi:hypothetical protein